LSLESSIPTKQVFSYGIVEAKRFRRTLTAVINGKTVPQAVREGLVETYDTQREAIEEEEPADDGESLFLPTMKPVSANPFANSAEQTPANPFAKTATPGFNPQARVFAPGMFQQAASKADFSTNPLAKGESAFPSTSQQKIDSPTTAAKSANPFSNSSGIESSFTPQSTPSKPEVQPFVFSNRGFTTNKSADPINTAPPPTNPTSFTSFTSQPTTILTTPSQPPAFAWPKQQENTQSTGMSKTILIFLFTCYSKQNVYPQLFLFS